MAFFKNDNLMMIGEGMGDQIQQFKSQETQK